MILSTTEKKILEKFQKQIPKSKFQKTNSKRQIPESKFQKTNSKNKSVRCLLFCHHLK
jgi:hypothetical protein